MTVETVPIIITRTAASESRQIDLSELEDELTRITTRTAQEEIVLVLEGLDDAMRRCVPKTWKNVGRERRNLVMEWVISVFGGGSMWMKQASAGNFWMRC